MKNGILIVGAGGHGKVVCDAIIAQNKYTVAGFADNTTPVGTPVHKGFEVIVSQDRLSDMKDKVPYFVIAIGNNAIRKDLFGLMSEIGLPATVIHPSAVVAPDAVTGSGTVVLAQAIVGTGAHVGKNCIVNSGVIIDHEVRTGDHSHFAIGTLIGSNCVLSDSLTTSIGERIQAFTRH